MQHLAAGLAQQRVMRAGRLDQRVEPAAHPVHPANPYPPALFGVAQDHQAGGRDVPEPLGGKISSVQALEHVVLEAVEVQERIQVVPDKAGPLGQADRPPQVSGLKRQIAAEPAAQSGRGRPPQRLAGRAVERGLERVGQSRLAS